MMDTPQDVLTTEQLFSRKNARDRWFVKRQLAAGVVTIFFGLFMWNASFGVLEKAFLDVWLSRPQPASESDVVLVSVSSQSLQKWPWTLSSYAETADLMSRFGAYVVYMDPALSKGLSQEEQKNLEEELAKNKSTVFFTADYLPIDSNANIRKSNLREKFFSEQNQNETLFHFAKHFIFSSPLFGADQDRIFRFWKPLIKDETETVYALAPLKIFSDLRPDLKKRTWEKFGSLNTRLILWDRQRFERWRRTELSDLFVEHPIDGKRPNPILMPDFFRGKAVFIGPADKDQNFSGITPWGRIVFPFELMAVTFDGLGRFENSISMVVPQWGSLIVFLLIASLLIVLSGTRHGKPFWIGCGGLFLGVCTLWLGFAVFSLWFQAGSLLLFLLIAVNVIYIFDTLSARESRSALFHLATRDGLTNLYTIRHFRVIMNQLTREASARRENLCVILLDIDYFKKINDTYGHPAGDLVIKETAGIIQRVVRQTREFSGLDFVARYGGEEFIVLVRRTSLENTANLIAERIRLAVANAHYTWQERRILVTVSLGVAALDKGENIPDPMVRRADKALYLAKRTGRNRVCTQADPHVD